MIRIFIGEGKCSLSVSKKEFCVKRKNPYGPIPIRKRIRYDYFRSTAQSVAAKRQPIA